jgi:toxin ParE1/3/4
MSRYRFTTSARIDLKEIVRYIARDNPEVGRKLKDKIKQQCQLLAKYPNMGRRRDELAPALRSFPVNEYLIFYLPIENGIEVERVVSGYRDLDTLFE